MTTDPTPGIRATGHDLWAQGSFSDADGYAFALPLVEGELHRADSSDGAVAMATRDFGRLHLSMIRVGFPVVGRVAPTRDAIVFGLILGASPGSRWDGRDLASGDVVLYPPGVAQNAVEQPGLRLGGIMIDRELVAEAIEALGRRPMELHRGPMRDDLARALMHAYTRAIRADDSEKVTAEVASVLSTSKASLGQPRRLLSSETITRRAIDYVHTTGDWAPSSLALCRATRVSERRLQLAFAEMYGMTPSGFFRLRALSMARRRLQQTEEPRAPVTTIATELGFYHLSRFAEEYRSVFGENPSETLANSRLRRSA